MIRDNVGKMRMMMIKLRAYNLQSIVIEVQEHNR
jgi:hypothetical protein